jgi:hypothetical protein
VFADPQSVTVNAVAQSLAAVSRNDLKSIYRKDDGAYNFTISHGFGAQRNNFRVRLDHNKLTTDPFVTANNIRVSSSVYLVMDMPVLGYTNTEIKDIALGLTGWATSANLLKVLGGET